MKRYLKISFAFFLIIACEKIYYYPDREIGEAETKFLAHKASGFNGFEDNTLNGAIFGLENYNGIEVDIQISKNGTLWLSHDAGLPDCGDIHPDCFIETPDYLIEKLDSCLGGQQTFSRLEDIFAYMAKNYPSKYISLDVKAWSSCDYIETNILEQLNTIGDVVIYLVYKYHLQGQVMVESEVVTFLQHVKKHSDGIDCYLSTLGDFERGMLIALEKRLHGISFKFKHDEEITIEHVKMIRRKGLRIQLWTIEGNHLAEAISLQPDFIQINNVDTSLLKASKL